MRCYRFVVQPEGEPGDDHNHEAGNVDGDNIEGELPGEDIYPGFSLVKLLHYCPLLAGSLWHKGAYNRTFPCMEANYPYAIKNQRGASKEPLAWGP